jgi:hypothetical protein
MNKRRELIAPFVRCGGIVLSALERLSPSRIVILSEVRTRSVRTQSKDLRFPHLDTTPGQQQVPPLRDTLTSLSKIVILSEVRTRSVRTQSKDLRSADWIPLPANSRCLGSATL